MFSQHFAWPKFYCSSCLKKKKTKHVFCTAGVGAPPAAHSVRALHSFRLPILRQCLLYDGGTLCLQHRLPAHERKGEVRLKTNVLYKFIRSVTFSCSVKRCSLRFCIIMQGLWLQSSKKRKKKNTQSLLVIGIILIIVWWPKESWQKCSDWVFCLMYSVCLVYFFLISTLKSLMACKCCEVGQRMNEVA